jgi:type VI secretion system protein ImpF
MAKNEIERTVQPSLLDRLTDPDPRSSTDVRVTFAESVRQFKVSIQRDLEWLLNTRRIHEGVPEDWFEQVPRSVYYYGIPDITSLSRDSRESRGILLRDVEAAIATFEPRLTDVHITVVEAEGEHFRRELRFHIEATLRMDPTPEQVVFDTVLNFASGEYDVAGVRDA